MAAGQVPLLEAEGIVLRFGTNLVLDGMSLRVGEQDVVCLIGPSGSGKSTFLRCVNGLETIEAGEIRLRGERISGRGVDLDQVRRRIGIVFQAYNLFPHMTVLDNVTLAPRRVLGLSRVEARERAVSLLDRIGLGDKCREYPDRLSGGQQQRAAIARALAMEPELLLLDEVTSALDPELVGEVLDLLRELAATAVTMVLATHEMSFAKDVATKVCFLHQGRILEEGPPSQLFTNPHEDRTRTFLNRVLAV